MLPLVHMHGTPVFCNPVTWRCVCNFYLTSFITTADHATADRALFTRSRKRQLLCERADLEGIELISDSIMSQPAEQNLFGTTCS